MAKAPFEIFDDTVKTGCMINPRSGVSKEIAALVFDLLVAGNWCLVTDDAIVVASKDSVRGLPRPDRAIPSDFPMVPARVVLVESPNEVARQLTR